MNRFRIALIHCPKSTTYKLVRMTPDLASDDPCIIWVFDSSKIKTAKKIAKNMNVAQMLNRSDVDVAFG